MPDVCLFCKFLIQLDVNFVILIMDSTSFQQAGIIDQISNIHHNYELNAVS